jgi:hypothetical protein
MSTERIQPVQVLLPDGGRAMGEFRIWEEAPEDQEAVRLELRFDDREFAVTTEDGFFEALTSLRKQFEPEGFRLECYGCSRRVYPSAMARSMGYGERAYRLEFGRQAKSVDLVSIFDSGPEVQPATLADQERYYRDWLESLSSSS